MTLTPDSAWHIEREYGVFDYTDAVVLDIGADYGCSPEFFLDRGAAHVVACEARDEWRELLTKWAEGRPVTVVGEVKPGNIAGLLTEHRPDYVKVDCEGCERVLLDAPDDVLAAPRGWVLETHTLDLYADLRALFERLGYRFSWIHDYGDEPNHIGMTCKIWKVER